MALPLALSIVEDGTAGNGKLALPRLLADRTSIGFLDHNRIEEFEEEITSEERQTSTTYS